MCGGDPALALHDALHDVLFPACAGVILGAEMPFPQDDAFPRMCGGDPLPDVLPVWCRLLFPACAGVILFEVIPQNPVRTFSPHVRG